jgi:hypothetical protein
MDVNNLKTSFELFFKNSRNMSAGELKPAQQRTLEIIGNRYLEFERVAWWWCNRVQRDARFPEPLENWRKDQLGDLCEQYLAQIKSTTTTLDEICTALLRVPSHAGRGAGQEALLKAKGLELDTLGNKRRDIVGKIASLFEQQEPDRWYELWRWTSRR